MASNKKKSTSSTGEPKRGRGRPKMTEQQKAEAKAVMMAAELVASWAGLWVGK